MLIDRQINKQIDATENIISLTSLVIEKELLLFANRSVMVGVMIIVITGNLFEGKFDRAHTSVRPLRIALTEYFASYCTSSYQIWFE